MDENDIISTIPQEICDLRERRLEKFIVDCPTKEGRGVGNYSNVRIGRVSFLATATRRVDFITRLIIVIIARLDATLVAIVIRGRSMHGGQNVV